MSEHFTLDSAEIEPVKYSVPEFTPRQKEVRLILDQMDEDTLTNIFRGYVLHSLGSDTEFNYIPLREIVIFDDEETKLPGAYLANTKQIVLNAQHLAGNEAAIIHTLIHEQLHALRHNQIGTEEQLSEFADEGLTEIIAEEIYLSYIRKVYKEGSPETETALAYLHANRENHEYGENQRAIDFYISLLATLGNVDDETMRFQIYTTYLRNGTIIPLETASALSEIAPNFGQKIADLLEGNLSQDLWQSIVHDLKNSPELSESEYERIMTTVHRIANERK